MRHIGSILLCRYGWWTFTVLPSVILKVELPIFIGRRNNQILFSKWIDIQQLMSSNSLLAKKDGFVSFVTCMLFVFYFQIEIRKCSFQILNEHLGVESLNEIRGAEMELNSKELKYT